MPILITILLLLGVLGILLFIIYPKLGPYTSLLAPIVTIIVVFVNYYKNIYHYVDYLCGKLGIISYSSLRTSYDIPNVINDHLFIQEHGVYEHNEHYRVRVRPFQIFQQKNNREISFFINGIISKIAKKFILQNAKYLCSFQGLSNELFGPLIDERLSIQHVVVSPTNVSAKINEGDKIVLLETYLFNFDHLGQIFQILMDLGAEIVLVLVIFTALKKEELITEFKRRGLKNKRICLGWEVDAGKHFAEPACRNCQPLNITHKDL